MDESQFFARTPHRRRNALTGEWVLVSPQRTDRPWQGQIEKPAPGPVSSPFDPACYLCPGNERAGGARNPAYSGTFVFENDFPALRPRPAAAAPSDEANSAPRAAPPRRSELLLAEPERGVCRVVCFSPRHDLTLATLPWDAVRGVVEVWAEQTLDLAARDFIRHVQIFENRGAMMGASNPHPHGQIWATEHLPNEVVKEAARFAAEAPAGCLLCRYLRLEVERGERVVFADQDWAAVVPFWAVWPFEVLLLPRAHAGDLPALASPLRDSLAAALRRLAGIYDRVFSVPFPYSMGWHQAPADRPPDRPSPERATWHLHAHFYPPLLRSAAVRKFMVGFELLGMPQRDLTPEAAAARLRALA